MIPARAGAKWMASVMPMLALFGCSDPKEDEEKPAEQSGKAPRKAVTVAAASSPSILDQAKATKRFSLPEGLFEADVIGDETAKELLVAAGLEFPVGTSAELDREANELEVTHFPTDLMLAEAVVDSWRWRLTAQNSGGVEAIEKTLIDIALPMVSFKEATLEEALAILEKESSKYDDAGEGIRIELDKSLLRTVESDHFELSPNFDADRERIEDLRITFQLAEIPLVEALREVTSIARLKYFVTDAGVLVTRLDNPGPSTVTRVFDLAPNFLDLAQARRRFAGRWRFRIFSFWR